MDKLTTAIVFLNIIAVLMTAGWILFSIIRGVTYLEIFYNYAYVTVVVGAFILNIIKIMAK